MARPQGAMAAARRPQGAATARGQAAGAVASGLQMAANRKAAYGQRHRPQGLSPARIAASMGSACRGSTCGGVARGSSTDRRGGCRRARAAAACAGAMTT
ncbi:hypothetical protein BHE74_00059277 [Ensete ventricosum]|nr:hypothetical protein BHE74_00059277 [Ensete ventricosum]